MNRYNKKGMVGFPNPKTNIGPCLQKNLLLGLGSSILADQSIVLKLIERVKPNFSHNIDFTTELISSLDLVHLFQQYKRLLVLDTIQTDHFPLGKMEFSAIDHSKTALHMENYHDSSILETIQVAGLLGMKVPEHIGMITVNVRDVYSLSEKHSSELQQQLPELTIKLEKYICEFFELEMAAISFVN